MKKIICLLLLVVIAVTMLAACGTKYACDDCGKKVDTVYSSEILGDEQYCKDCYNDLLGFDVIE